MPHGPLAEYRARLRSGDIRADPAQELAAEKLESLAKALTGYQPQTGRTGWKERFGLARRRSVEAPQGLYIYGGVGRGKSMLMDIFFRGAPVVRKRRVHFHAFMQEIHGILREVRAQAVTGGRPRPGVRARDDDILPQVAQRIAADAALLCFDELQVLDIADAMILGRLLEALFAHGVVFVMTSNYPPDRLYPNGLQRDNFLPTIALLKSRLDVLEIDAGVDYRLRTLEQVEIFHYPADAAAELKMAGYFAAMADGEGEPGGTVEILGRNIPTQRRGNGVIWFDFKSLCGGPRSQNDYLELARGYHTVLLSAIPRMSASMSSEARRFTWLVDIFYDHKVKLIATADCGPDGLYTQGTQASEFCRTASRLTEMRSRAYLGLPHLS